ncbi:unnamed protein product [Microthlaspi erraticum]|uniref:Uncharacterized protein n=1 Tax=Microthlaspi erraticum TaxID=1685480 RepID=A0A6D2JBZ6_9BRAS|nr:unnamed protein product [Microthlaspi erraticum]
MEMSKLYERLSKCTISFASDEDKCVLAPHHDALVISLTIANSLMKRTLVDNGSSTNILFMDAYKGLGLDENALTRKSTPCAIDTPSNHKISYSMGSQRDQGRTRACTFMLPNYLKGKGHELYQLEIQSSIPHTKEAEVEQLGEIH